MAVVAIPVPVVVAALARHRQIQLAHPPPTLVAHLPPHLVARLPLILVAHLRLHRLLVHHHLHLARLLHLHRPQALELNPEP